MSASDLEAAASVVVARIDAAGSSVLQRHVGLPAIVISAIGLVSWCAMLAC